MKILITIFIFFISTLFSANIDFKEAKQHPTRDSVDKNSVASYHDGIKNGILSVVNISAKKLSKQNGKNFSNNPFLQDPFFRQFFDKQKGIRPQKKTQIALGSGVIVSEDGYIITNNHVISHATSIVVTLSGSTKEYNAKLIGTDPRGDLALIKIDGKKHPYIEFANSDDAKVGDVVFAIGNPFGVGESVTKGIVSAKNKSGLGVNEYEDFIQTDASINPGNSGGALVDSRGALVGISTAIISKGQGSVGIGFAIPSNTVKKTIKSLITTGVVKRGYLGVSVANLDSSLFAFYNSNRGALITNVDINTPADIAGIKRGDLIIEIDDKDIHTATNLKTTIGSYEPNSKIDITILRGKNKIYKSIVLADSPSDISKGTHLKQLEGISLKEINKTVIQKYSLASNARGILVVDVAYNSQAYKNGLARGDIIVQIEDIQINKIDDLNRAFKRLANRQKRIWIFRNGAFTALVVD
jgi:serine protease Do